MHTLMIGELAQQHIDDLHREAARWRLRHRSREARERRRRPSHTTVQRAPAHGL
jgi:hypothetical protein